MRILRLTLSVIGTVVVIATTFIVWHQRRLAQSRAEIDCLRSRPHNPEVESETGLGPRARTQRLAGIH